MSIKNKHIIHYIKYKNDKFDLDNRYYICNHACYITQCKSTRNKYKVTCKNCLRLLNKNKISCVKK